jgi:hypothetical protein
MRQSDQNENNGVLASIRGKFRQRGWLDPTWRNVRLASKRKAERQSLLPWWRKLPSHEESKWAYFDNLNFNSEFNRWSYMNPRNQFGRPPFSKTRCAAALTPFLRTAQPFCQAFTVVLSAPFACKEIQIRIVKISSRRVREKQGCGNSVLSFKPTWRMIIIDELNC